MIPDIKELNFPKDESGRQYATLTQATVTLQDMAEKTITSQVKIDGQIAPDFSYDWAVEFKGEKYIMPLRQPQGAKENTSLDSTIDLTFQHWAVYWLKQKYFFQYTSNEAGTAIPDKWIVPLRLNLKDFCVYLEKVCEYWYGDKITVDLNPDWEYDPAPVGIDISYSYVWDVLIKLYENYAVRWQIEPNGDLDHYVIKVGYKTTEISHVFRYGFEGGLLKVERQVQDDNIRNMILGRGGEKNLPYRYFKKHDKDNESFSPDPDWIPELKDIPFSELHGATFRSYIQGWKAAHIKQYREESPDEEWIVTTPSADKAYAPWAWMRGNTDERFNPVEFVADEFNTESNGNGVVTGSSIARYGELMGGLENNEEIYPTIQGVVIPPYDRIDEAVEVEPILSDDVQESVENDSQLTTLPSIVIGTCVLSGNARESVSTIGEMFTVPEGMIANYDEGVKNFKIDKEKLWLIPGLIESGLNKIPVGDGAVEIEEKVIEILDAVTKEPRSASNIPAGDYYPKISFKLHNTKSKTLYVSVECPEPKLTYSTPDKYWGQTWSICVKNIWGTKKGIDADGNPIPGGETDEQYAERVWRPILGDRVGNEAKIVFSDGWLSTSEDYEFTIIGIPTYERKKCEWETIENGVRKTYSYWSEWRIQLAKSDADLESLGLYVPSTKRQAVAGDHFFFVGIDMPHMYVVEAEKRLDDWKKDELAKVRDIKPTWVVGLDKVRISDDSEGQALIDKLRTGDIFTLEDKRFIEAGAREKLYLQSITYNYKEPTSQDAALTPDVEIVLSDKYKTVASPVAQLAGDVSALQRQIGSISNVEQIVRAVCDKLYLRKDGFADRSMSPTEFLSLVTSADFRSGIIGGAGWGIYRDSDGSWVVEADRLKARNDLEVNNLIINQVSARGGTIVESAAQMEITRVVETNDGFICYFDQHDGSVANLFVVDDIAFNTRYTPENENLKIYKRRVTAVTQQSVTLSKTDASGRGVPAAGDVIVQYGNYNIPSRRYVKVRDVIGGGYERYIEGLDSVNAAGTEYFFAGRMNGESPRLLIGDKSAEYAEWKDGKLTIKGSLSVLSTIGDKTIGDIFNDLDLEYIKKALKPLSENTTVKGGLVLTSEIWLGDNNDDYTTQNTYSGISGVYDSKEKGYGIAAWYGGSKIDAEIEGNELLPNRARALFRMDGTGYLSDGKLSWDSKGNLIFGSGIIVEGLDESLNNTLTSIIKAINGINALLTPVKIEGGKEIELKFEQYGEATALKTELDLYSKRNMSALGATTDAGTGGTGGGGSLFGLMRDWPAADPGKGTEDALGANLGWELRQGLADARTLLDTHVADSARHITGSERTRWNKTATDLSAIMGSDGDNILNKWEEIVAFLATCTEADTLANLLSNKADKSQLAGYVTLDTEQKITGQKIFGTHLLVDCPWDTNDRYLFFREGGTSSYGGYVKYTGKDKLIIGTRNGDETVDVDAIEIVRGSKNVTFNGGLRVADYTTFGNGLSVTGTVTADTIKRRGGTSLQLLTADGGIRTLHSLGAVGNLGWSGTSGQVASINTLAHWNGCFMGTQSNLLYCAKGAFGDIVTKNTADFTVWAHGTKNYKGTQYVLLGVCPPTSDSTYDSLHITGDFGGYNSNGRCAVDVYVGRRNGVRFRGFANHESPENWDIGINDAGEVYLIFHYQWCAYNLNLFALQAEIKWNGKVSTPTDTNFVLLSQASDVAHFMDSCFKGTSNVAVRLERVSRLWGRPFDGTGDVMGSLTSVADITMSGKLTIGGCEITWDAAQGALRFSTSAYSEGEMASKGATSDSGSSSGGTTGGGSYDRLDSWAAYSSDKAGYVLSALLGYDLHTRLTQAASDISSLGNSVSANAGNITSLGNRLTAIEGLDIAELSDIVAAKTAVKNDVAKLYVTALGARGDVVLWYKNGVENMLAVPYATETSRLRSVVAGDISTIRYHRLTYLSSAVPLGTGAGQAREGSYPEFGTWSYPKKGVYAVENGNANIQALRLTWSGMYFHEIMTSPNYNDLWHRSVNNGKAGEWERFITTGNMYRYLGESFRLRRRYTVDLSHLDTGTFYPVMFAGDKLELDCEISSPSGTSLEPWNNNHIHFILTSLGWSDVRTTFSMLSCGNYDSNEITIGSVVRGLKQGYSCVFLRGGLKYDVIANREPELKETGYTGYSGESYMPGADITGGDNVSVGVLWRNDSTRDDKTVVIRETLTNELAALGNSIRSEITTLGNTLRSEAASKYLPRSVFDELFGKELQADGSYAIRAKFSLYSDGEVASKGAASGQGTGGSGVNYDRLDSWNDYNASAGAVLSATLGYGLLSDINALRTEVTALKGAGFLTEHQDISHLLNIDGSNGTAAGVQTLIGKLPVWGGAPTDSALFIAQSTSYPNQWGLRTTSSLWNWLKPKTDAVYQPKGDYQTPNGYVASLYSANALPLKSNSLQYYSGQPTKDLCFEGSSTDLSLWSYPGPGITSVGENSVNIQSLRMWFGSLWLNEIFCSPNANGLWYRHAVNNSTAMHEWERLLSDANFHTVTGKDYVRIIGDKMTGRLTAPSIGINGAGSSACLTADAAYNAYISIDGKNLMVWKSDEMCIRAGLSQHDKVTLGTSATRWKNVYATTINVSSAELVSKLNADMVDGHHEGDFLINRGGNYDGLLYDLPCKSFYSAQNIEDAPVTGWISGIVLGANFNSNHYQQHLVADVNNRWYSGRWYADGKMERWEQFAYLSSNVASATRLQTTRSIWGQGFNGTADISGDLRYVRNAYLQNNIMWNLDGDGTYLWGGAGTGNESIFSLNTHSAGVFKKQLLKVTGDGNFGINVYTPTYLLHVGGSFCAAGAAQLNSTLTVNGGATLKSAVTVNGQLTATGNAIVRGTLDVNGILTATNKVRLYDELFFEPAGNAGPYLSPAAGKLSIAFHDNYTWVSTPIVLDKDGLLTLDGRLKIGGVTLSYDASQGALRIEGNAYATGNIASLGLASDAALLPEGMLTETFIGRLNGGGEVDEPVGAVIDFNDLSSLESYSGLNAKGEEDVLFNLGYLGINGGVVREIGGKSYADYGKIALAVMPLIVEKVGDMDTRLADLSNRVAALEKK